MATLMWSRSPAFPDPIHLQAILFNAQGSPVAAWRIATDADHPLFIDSAVDGPWRQAHGSDGILALYVCADAKPGNEARRQYERFMFPLLDWRESDGRVTTLHSDQVIKRGEEKLQRFTEMVVVESEDERNALVVLNGEEHQRAGALEITFKNTRGDARSATYAVPMQPFTAHRIVLASLLPELAAFSEGEPLLISGAFASRGLYTRPYVETTGRRWGAYHAGDVYNWHPLPYFAHALIGGEVNPMAVLHGDGTRTFVNLLHSHGDLDDDVWVDVALFDINGVCVARRNAWRQACRHRLTRFDVAGLLPDPALPFCGHIALSFAPEPGRPVPGRLQALLEYRRQDSVARVMAWSDEWNSAVRLARRDLCADPPSTKSYCRVFQDMDTGTEVAITNAGHPGYDRVADVRMTLYGTQGQIYEKTLRLPPYATCMATTEQLFPDAIGALAPSGIGLLLVESESDLANVSFTRHRRTGAIAAEHFLPMLMEHRGEMVHVSGS